MGYNAVDMLFKCNETQKGRKKFLNNKWLKNEERAHKKIKYLVVPRQYATVTSKNIFI